MKVFGLLRKLIDNLKDSRDLSDKVSQPTLQIEKKSQKTSTSATKVIKVNPRPEAYVDSFEEYHKEKTGRYSKQKEIEEKQEKKSIDYDEWRKRTPTVKNGAKGHWPRYGRR
jgi:hypothetical protein